MLLILYLKTKNFDLVSLQATILPYFSSSLEQVTPQRPKLTILFSHVTMPFSQRPKKQAPVVDQVWLTTPCSEGDLWGVSVEGARICYRICALVRELGRGSEETRAPSGFLVFPASRGHSMMCINLIYREKQTKGRIKLKSIKSLI